MHRCVDLFLVVCGYIDQTVIFLASVFGLDLFYLFFRQSDRLYIHPAGDIWLL